MTCPVAGTSESKVAPLAASTKSPPMNACVLAVSGRRWYSRDQRSLGKGLGHERRG